MFKIRKLLYVWFSARVTIIILFNNDGGKKKKKIAGEDLRLRLHNGGFLATLTQLSGFIFHVHCACSRCRAIVVRRPRRKKKKLYHMLRVCEKNGRTHILYFAALIIVIAPGTR